MRAQATILAGVALFAAALQPAARAESWEDALRGGLLGAAVGAIVGHNSSDLDTSVAVPAFAAAGALLGYAYDRDGAYYGYDPYLGYGYDSYGYPHHRRHGYDRDWDRPYWRSWRYRNRPYPYRQPQYRVIRDARPPREVVVVPRAPRTPPPDPVNRHPGVELMMVPIATSNGTPIDIRILLVNGLYIGPKGEVYEEKPTPEQLAERYRP